MSDQVVTPEPTASTVPAGYITTAVTLVLGLILLVILLVRSTRRPYRFPPGPPCLPFIGNLLDLIGGRSEVLATRWAKQYGDVFSIRIGDRWAVILNYQDVIKEAMIKNGVAFAGRPQFYSAELVSDGFKDIAFSSYTDTWKLHRKLAHSALRQFATGQNLDKLVHGVLPEVDKLLQEKKGKPLDPKLMITLTLYNVLSKMCFGESYGFDDPKLMQYITMSQEMGEKIGFGLLADYFPWAKYIPMMPGPGYILDFKQKYLDWTIPQMKRHRETLDPDNVRDFCDLMILAQREAEETKQKNVENLSDLHLVHTINDIFVAGIETSMQRMYWSLALMAEYPDIQAKVQEEIDSVIGRGRHPVIADRGSLPYSEATLYEIVRFGTVGPVGVPHATTEDVEFRGFLIPKDTTVVLNHFSMHFDEREWKEPYSFRPEHFLDESGTMRQHPSSFLPFGLGRRSCLGEAVAKADMFLIFTFLMQNYTFKKTSDKSVLNLLPDSVAGRILMSYELMIEERP